MLTLIETLSLFLITFNVLDFDNVLKKTQDIEYIKSEKHILP